MVMADGRGRWWVLLAAIVAAGLLSRATHTGLRLVDKYAGDALYAAMVYALLRLSGRVERVALWTAVVMTALELFQLTGIPAALYRDGPLPVRLLARLLGTEFSALDLVAYAAGIAGMIGLDRLQARHGR